MGEGPLHWGLQGIGSTLWFHTSCFPFLHGSLDRSVRSHNGRLFRFPSLNYGYCFKVLLEAVGFFFSLRLRRLISRTIKRHVASWTASQSADMLQIYLVLHSGKSPNITPNVYSNELKNGTVNVGVCVCVFNPPAWQSWNETLIINVSPVYSSF